MDLHHGHHADHLHQLHNSTQQPTTHKPSAEAEEEEDFKPRPLLPLSLPNGTLKKHRRQEPPPLSWSRLHGREHRKNHVVYRECMKNHAAPLGGHALDGCGEFMPTPGSNASEPASLTCAACGCHRNFHRRLLHNIERGEAGPEVEDGDEEGHSPSPPPPRQGAGFIQYSSSSPHMLMALSTVGFHGGPVGTSGSPPVTAGTTSAGTGPGVVSRTFPAKRFRTKFSPEQKAMMQDLCERLGWRMQRRDDALVEQRCREIGVSRGVFKVWMHNNKHAFVGGPSSRRGGGGGGGGGGTVETTSCGEGGGGGGEGVSVNGDSGNGGATGHAMNCSPVSS